MRLQRHLGRSQRHPVVGRGAELQAVRGPRIGPRDPRAGPAQVADGRADREGEEPEHGQDESTWPRRKRSPSTGSSGPTRSKTCTSPFGNDYAIELLGRTGEVKPDRPVQLSFKHREFKEQVQVTLKTRSAGRVHLGPLADIVTVTATGPEGTSHTWTLSTDAHTYRSVMHAKAGEVVALPYLGTRGQADPRGARALRGPRQRHPGRQVRVARHPERPARTARPRRRRLRPVAEATRREDPRSRRRWTDVQAGYVLGSDSRHATARPQAGLDPVDRGRRAMPCTIRLRDQSKFTRVHVFATRYQPAFNAFANLARVRDAELGGVMPGHADSVYLTGRNIGDEYRYVLDRRGQKKYPGNMLERPSCCSTRGPSAPPRPASNSQSAAMISGPAAQFEPHRQRFHRPAYSARPAAERAVRRPAISPTSISSPIASAVLLNLIPDKDGVSQAAAQGHRAARDDPRRRRRSARHHVSHASTLPEPPAQVRRSAARRTASTRRSTSRSRSR